MNSSPVFVIVPGASQTPSHYAHIIHLLQARGHGTLTALLPSGGATRLVSAAEDAEFVRSRMILPILDIEKYDVILIMHSYGGLPGSAAARGLGSADRATSGRKTAVLGQIFIASILPHGGNGEDVIALLGGKWPSFIDVHESEQRIKCDQPKIPLYDDVPPLISKGTELSSISQSIQCFTSPCPLTSWHEEAFFGRCAYIRTRNDQAVPYEVQNAMLDSTVTMQNWVIRDIAAGNSPQLALPEKLVEIILAISQQFEVLPLPTTSREGLDLSFSVGKYQLSSLVRAQTRWLTSRVKGLVHHRSGRKLQ